MLLTVSDFFFMTRICNKGSILIVMLRGQMSDLGRQKSYGSNGNERNPRTSDRGDKNHILFYLTPHPPSINNDLSNKIPAEEFVAS